MYSRESLLNEFFTTIDRTQVKVESKSHGMDYIKSLRDAAQLDYGEYKNSVYKYRLSGVKPDIFAELLKKHVNKEINLCIYFHSEKNNLFAFNLDSRTGQGSELKVMALYMADCLMKLGMPPLVIKSGHGYHLWCRICEPVENRRLQAFMDELVEKSLHKTQAKGLDAENLQCICYPRPKASDISIRLFGSEHMITGRFSSVVTGINAQDTVLGEEKSWDYFKDYMNECTVSKALFEKAFEDMAKMKTQDRTE